MPIFIPFLVGAGATGYAWYNSGKEEKEETTFGQELLKILTPVFLIILVLLIFRWLYLQGSKNSELTNPKIGYKK